MKKNIIYFVTLFIISFQSFSFWSSAPDHHVPKTAEDQGEDIPQIGSSLFDKVFSEKGIFGGVSYDIPFPIGDLMKKITRENQFDVLHTMLPFSRSLQRPQPYGYDPLLNPRLVFSSKYSNTYLERAKLFIGYVKAADQLEVISYNDEAGRFEYQLVKNYSKDPEVFYVNRGKCLSCHQGQAPIFSVPGWNDTNSGILGNLIGAKIGVDNANSLKGKIEVAKKLFGGTPSLDAVGNFDALVRESNEIAFHERVWAIGCGKNDKCRLGLLLKALAPNSRETAKYYEYAKEVIIKSDLVNQNHYSSFLSSNDLGAASVIRQYGSYEEVARNSDAILEIVTNINSLADRDNPGTRRLLPMTKDRLFPTTLKTFNNKDFDIIQDQIPRVEKHILELFENDHEIFSQSAINKPLIMATLLDKIGSPTAEIYKNFIKKKTPEKKLFKGRTIPTFRERELNIFARYCYQCHATGLSFPPQFLLGTEEQVKSNIYQLRHKVYKKLTHKLMPPNKKERDLLHRSGDYDILIEYIENLLEY